MSGIGQLISASKAEVSAVESAASAPVTMNSPERE